MTPDDGLTTGPHGAAKIFRTQELAEIAGTTPRALRHYHQIGLLPEVQREANGYRRYTIGDLVRVLRIRQLATGGMPLGKIGEVLQQDAQRQDDMLAQLDAELERQAHRIRVQQELVAELRNAAARPAWVAPDEPPTATEQFDKDVWTLVTASAALDAPTRSTLQTIRTLLDDQAVLEAAAGWYPQFVQLELCSQIDEKLANGLTEQMADFVTFLHEKVSATVESSAPSQEVPLAALIEQLHLEAFSPAQQDVWRRFMSIMSRGER